MNAASLAHLVGSLADLSTRQAAISNQLSTGIRLNQISDDPSVAGQAITVADSLARDVSFLSSSSTAINRMQAADTALSAVVTQLTSAVSTAVQALGDTVTDSGRATAAEQLQSVRESLLSLANSSYGGTYLFSGASSSVPFTEAADGTVTYTGASETSTTPLSSGGSVQSSLAGASVFLASGASAFGALNDLITAMQSGSSTPTQAATLVGNLRSALSNVTSQRALLNTAQSRVSDESDYVTAQKTSLEVQQSTLLSADTASLATELSAVTTQRNALLSTISIVQKGSLFDYL